MPENFFILRVRNFGRPKLFSDRPSMSLLIVLSLLLVFIHPNQGHAQNVDTLVEVGGYKLHFNIIKGKGTPILFEAGGGEDATTWENIITKIAAVTKTTLIMYDRAGFGRSTFDTTKHGILNGVIGLETGLRKLHYNGNVILVAHSQGGLYATLYASRHPENVKAAVLIDATTSCFYEETRLNATQRIIDAQKNNTFKKSNPGSYYQGADFSNNINFVRNVTFPKNIPVIDFVAEYPPFSEKKDIDDWKTCHKEFATTSPHHTGIIAYGCGHFIFEDNPPLVIHAIVKAYATTLDKTDGHELLKREADYAINATNDRNREEMAYRHSAEDLNSWGYQLLEQGDLQKALQVFKLNIELNPNTWYIYEGYGEALLKNGEKSEAIKMYQTSVRLNPNNEKGKKVLEQILKQ